MQAGDDIVGHDNPDTLVDAPGDIPPALQEPAVLLRHCVKEQFFEKQEDRPVFRHRDIKSADRAVVVAPRVTPKRPEPMPARAGQAEFPSVPPRRRDP
jgi:hypothetical protein